MGEWVVAFLFSSRRRHTRSLRDWSSDVCSSDLIGAGVLPTDSSVTYDRIGLTPAEQRQIAADKRRAAGRAVLAARSEERRVGKECRWRWCTWCSTRQTPSDPYNTPQRCPRHDSA